MISLFAAAAILSQDTTPLDVPAPRGRFEYSAPLIGLPPIMADTYGNGQGLAQQTARARNLQARIMWIDGTANLDKVDTPEKIQALVKQISDTGFNTIVFDIKPISGQVLYKSKIAPKIKSWKGKTLPEDIDPLLHMSKAAKDNGMTLLVSMNAFSEGHSLFKEGPGYEKPQLQTVLYEPMPILQAADEPDQWKRIAPTLNQMPPDDYVGVFTDAAKVPLPQEDRAVVAISSTGYVLSDPEEETKPTLPPNGSVVVTQGELAEWLREIAHKGSKLNFTSIPRFVPISNRPEQQYPLMMNPHNPEVQQYALDIVNEVMSNYEVSGMVYDDRLRYAGLNADFSPLASEMFEEYVGKKLAWPQDVFEYTFSPRMVRGMRPGKYYDAWLTWRALQMRNWVAKVRSAVMNARPNSLFGIYAGSWYGEYPKFGINYAAPTLEAGFWFLTPSYRKTGIAPQLDMLITGCYYNTPTIYDAMVEGGDMGRTVEFAGQMSNSLARDETWTYAGIQLSNYKNNPEGLEKALQAACASTQGVMVFDLSHDIEPMWPVFKKAFAKAALAPHDITGLINDVRAKREFYDSLAAFPRPVSVAAGAAGTGH